MNATSPAILVALILMAGPDPVRGQDVGLAIGSKPAAALVEDLDGNAVDLAQYVGKKPLLVEFWATWCPLCAALEPKLEAAHAKYGSEVEFLVVGVGVNQTPRSIRRHLERRPMVGRVLFDAKGAGVRAFKAPTTSYIAVLDASGAVQYTGTGEDQDIDAAIRRALGR